MAAGAASMNGEVCEHDSVDVTSRLVGLEEEGLFRTFLGYVWPVPMFHVSRA